MTLKQENEIIPMSELSVRCLKCRDLKARGGYSMVDLAILHDNDHMWPGFAGEPSEEDYGGSDF